MQDNRMDQEVIVGEVDAVFFENPKNYYKVVRIEVNQEETTVFLGDSIVITGQFATLQTDTTYAFYGRMTNHPKYGEQFAVSHYQQVTPSTESGVIDYLASHRFRGVGETLASRIVDKLGINAIDEIIDNAKVLEGIKGLSTQVAEELRQTLLETQGTERIFMQLNQWGFGPKISERIYQAYKSKATEIIQENPYELIEKVEGIGFATADELAAQLNFEPLSVERLMAGVYVAVYNITNSNGDTYISVDQAKDQAQKILESSRRVLIPNDLLDEAMVQAIKEERIMKLSDGLMLPSVYYAEVNIARQLYQYHEFEQIDRFSDEAIDDAIIEVIDMTGIQYDQHQQEALRLSISSPMSVITGGPGTGKTTLIKGLILMHSILHDYNLEEAQDKPDDNPILLAAPTGRASKRMQETTGLPASTIHRLIGFTREETVDEFYGHELEGTFLIVDEMSMVDTWLMNWLMQSIPYHMQVIFVGDKDQLPSVGPGRVFADIIESEVMPAIKLSRIYRQSEGSSIVELASSIRQGYLPEDFLEKKADRSFIQAPSSQIISVVEQIVSIAAKNGFNPTNFQVLAPMYKGPAGINALNSMLQALLNPPAPKKREITHFDHLFRVGDKVLQLVNDAEDGVYNGDVGQIDAIFTKNETESKRPEVVVSFDDVERTYGTADLDQLTLAYCTSIHKAQGSEYPLVILPLVDTYSRMLRKDLVYTAITRAQRSLIMVGNPHSFDLAVSRQQVPRQTFLKDLLRVQFGESIDEGPIPEGESEEAGEVEEAREELDPAVQEKATLTETAASNQSNEPSQVTLPDEPAKKPVPEHSKPEQSKSYVLTPENYRTIDPMIGMAGATPEDFK